MHNVLSWKPDRGLTTPIPVGSRKAYNLPYFPPLPPSDPQLPTYFSHALNNLSSVILLESGPGSGKTTRNVMLLRHMLDNLQEGEKILFTSPNNVAVNVAASILESIIPSDPSLQQEQFLRLFPRDAHYKPYGRECQSLALGPRLSSKNSQDSADLASKKEKFLALSTDLLDSFNLSQDLKDLNQEVNFRLQQLRPEREAYYDAAEQYLLDRPPQIIFTTTTSANHHLLQGFRYRYILLDEASQCDLISSLDLITKLANNGTLILIGDPHQLSPVSLIGGDVGLFSQWTALDIQQGAHLTCPRYTLYQVYRSSPAMLGFVNENIYKGLLLSSIPNHTPLLTQLLTLLDRPLQRLPIIFYDLDCFADKLGKSWYNTHECKAALNLLFTLLPAFNYDPSKFRIISYYGAQVSHLRRLIYNYQTVSLPVPVSFEELHIDTVDSSQGSQAEVVILSTVRGSNCQGIGFVNDARRLTVALTRAKTLLIILGNHKVLTTDQLWARLLNHLRLNMAIA